MVKRQIDPNLRIDCILMIMVMPSTNISKKITSMVKNAYGQKIKLFNIEILYSIRALEAIAEGKNIFDYVTKAVRLTQLMISSEMRCRDWGESDKPKSN